MGDYLYESVGKVRSVRLQESEDKISFFASFGLVLFGYPGKIKNET